jgi:hypothetical protein
VQATGFKLPERARLQLRFEDVANGAVLHQQTVTTDADGSLVLKAKVPLTGSTTSA